MISTTCNCVRTLNDAFRTAVLSPLGQWAFTHGVHDLGPEFVSQAIGQVRTFEAFTKDNDPYGEHDFGSLNISGHTVFFKIDYYDQNLEFGSEDPGDPAKCRRVLTVMLASEY